MTDKESSDRLQQLIDDWCDGTINSEDAAELTEYLAEDEAARREFLRCTELHALLLTGDAALAAVEPDFTPTPTPSRIVRLVDGRRPFLRPAEKPIALGGCLSDRVDRSRHGGCGAAVLSYGRQ